MKKVEIYKSWKEFLSRCNLSYWENKWDGVVEYSVESFLNSWGIHHEEVILWGKEYTHIIDYWHCEYFVRNIDNPMFWVIYMNFECEGTVFFSKRTANRFWELKTQTEEE